MTVTVPPENRLLAIFNAVDRIQSESPGWTDGPGGRCRLVPEEALDDLISACWDLVPGVPDVDAITPDTDRLLRR